MVHLFEVESSTTIPEPVKANFLKNSASRSHAALFRKKKTIYFLYKTSCVKLPEILNNSNGLAQNNFGGWGGNKYIK